MKNEKHECQFVYIHSTQGDYKVCRGCNKTILVFAPHNRP